MKNLDFNLYDFDQIMTVFNQSDYMREQNDHLREFWESHTLGQINHVSPHFEKLGETFEEFLTSAANQIALQEGDEWAAVHPFDEVREAIRAEVASNQPKDTDPDRVRFNVYAGYYELYLTTKTLPAPYMWQAVFDDVEDALNFMDYTDPEAQIFCTDTREYLHEELRDELDDTECGHFYKMWHEVPTEEPTDHNHDRTTNSPTESIHGNKIVISFSPWGNYTASIYNGGGQLIACDNGITADEALNEVRCWLHTEGHQDSTEISPDWDECYLKMRDRSMNQPKETATDHAKAVDYFAGLSVQYEDADEIKNALRSLYSNGDITEDDYDYILTNWDALLPTEEPTDRPAEKECVKFEIEGKNTFSKRNIQRAINYARNTSYKELHTGMLEDYMYNDLSFLLYCAIMAHYWEEYDIQIIDRLSKAANRKRLKKYIIENKTEWLAGDDDAVEWAFKDVCIKNENWETVVLSVKNHAA